MDLKVLLSRNNYLTIETWYKYVLQLWKGLIYYHKHKFVHLDIKPNNIAYIHNKGFYFIDFDWSIHLKSCKDVNAKIREIRSAENADTAEYWAPILSRAKTYLECDDSLLYFNDVFALCVVTSKIFKMLGLWQPKNEAVYQFCFYVIKSQDTSISALNVYNKIYDIFNHHY